VEDSLPIGGNTNYFDPATQSDEDAVMQIAPFQNNFARLRIPLLAKSCYSSNLTIVKLGKPCLSTDIRNVPLLMTLEVSLYRSTPFLSWKSGDMVGVTVPGAEPVRAKRKVRSHRWPVPTESLVCSRAAFCDRPAARGDPLWV